MDKVSKGYNKPSLSQSKTKKISASPLKLKPSTNNPVEEDPYYQQENLNNKSYLQGADLSKRIEELTSEIAALKEKLADSNLANVHLKNILRDRTPGVSSTKKISRSNEHQQERSTSKTHQQALEQRQDPSPSLLIQNAQNYFNEELKEKDRLIEQLKEKSKQLESLVITLESKLDKSNNLLPSIIEKAKDYHRLYDEARREMERITQQHKEQESKKESYSNLFIKQEETQKLLQNQIEYLSHINNNLKEEQKQYNHLMDEMKKEVTLLNNSLKDKEKALVELSKIKEENSKLKEDIIGKANQITSLNKEIASLNSKQKLLETDSLSKLEQSRKDNEKMRNDLITLQSNLDALTKKNASTLTDQIKQSKEANDTVSVLKKKLTQKEDEIAKAASQLSQSNEAGEALKSEVDKLTKAIQKNDKLLSDLSKLKRDNEELESDKQKHKIQFEVNQLEQKEKSKEIAKQKKEIDALKQTIEELKEELTKLQRDTDAKNQLQISNLKTQLSQTEEKHRRLEGERESTIKELTAQCNKKDNEVIELKKTVKQRQNEIDEIKEESNEKDSEMVQLRKENDNLQKSIQDIAKSRSDLASKLKKSTDDSQSQTASNEQLSKQLTQLKNDMKELKAKHEAGLNDYQSQLKRLNKEKEDEAKALRSSFDAKDNEVKALLKEKESFIEKNSTLQEEVKGLLTEANELKTREEEKDALIETMKKEKDIDEDKGKETADMRQEYEEKIELMESLLNDQVSRIEELTNQNEQLQQNTPHKESFNEEEKDNEANADIAQLKDHLQSLQKELEIANSNFDELKVEYSIINTHYEDLKTAHILLKKQFEELAAKKPIEDVDEAINQQELIDKLKEDNKEIAKKQEESSSMYSSIKDKYEVSSKEKAEIKRMLSKKELEVNDAKRKNEDMSSDILRVQSQLTEAQNKVKRMQGELKDKEDALIVLHGKCDKQLSEVEGVVKEKDQLIQMIDSLNTVVTDKDKEVNRKDKEIASLKHQLSQTKQEHEDKMKDLQREYEHETQQLKESIAQLKEESNLKETNQNNEAKLEQLSDQLNQKEQQLQDLNTTKAANEKLIDTFNNAQKAESTAKVALEAQLIQLKKDFEDERQEVARLKVSISSLEEKGNYKDNIIQEMQDQNLTLTMEREDLINQLSQAASNEKASKLLNENEELKAQLKIVIEESSKLSLASQSVNEEEAGALRLESAELKEDNKRLIKDIEQLKRDMFAQSELLNKELIASNNLKDQLNQLTQERDSFKHQLSTTEATLSKLQAEHKASKVEEAALAAQIVQLTTNSKLFTSEIEKRSDEIAVSLQKKEAENVALAKSHEKQRIELKTLKEEFDEMAVALGNCKEALIKKDIEMKESEEGQKKDIEDIQKIKEEYAELTGKLADQEELANAYIELQEQMTEMETEIENYQKINDKLIQANQELREKLSNKKSSKEEKGGDEEGEPIENDEAPIDKEDYIGLQMKNDTLEELIQAKEEEINALKEELENYKREVDKALRSKETLCKEKDISPGVSVDQIEDNSKLNETLAKYKKAYKDKANEVNMLQQQLSLLKGDIRNYQSKLETVSQANQPIQDFDNFKLKVLYILENFKTNKKEQIELIKDIREELGDFDEEVEEEPQKELNTGFHKK